MPSLQSTGLPLQIAFSLHRSLVVHGLSSLHGPTKYSFTHWPFETLQKSLVHLCVSAQSFCVPVQIPPLQISERVQGLLSLQEVAGTSGRAVLTHPSVALHESVVQALLSLQAESTGEKTHPVDWLHVSVVQAMLSLQVIVVPPQTPLKHLSSAVHALPSLHGRVLGVKMHIPVVGLQESVVHGLLSLHVLKTASHKPDELQTPLTMHLLDAPHEIPGAGTCRHSPSAARHESVVHSLLSLQFFGLPVRHWPSSQ